MIKAARQMDSGMRAELVAREHGVSRTTLYKLESEYSVMDNARVRHLKELEEESRKQKRVFVNLMLDY